MGKKINQANYFQMPKPILKIPDIDVKKLQLFAYKDAHLYVSPLHVYMKSTDSH